MASNKDELEALRRIEQLLEQQADAQAPGAAAEVTQEREEEPPVDTQAIAEAEAAAAEPRNQNETTNALLEQILTELQTLSAVIQELTS